MKDSRGVRLIVVCIGSGMVGVPLLWRGMQGLQSGQMLIKMKTGLPYIAYAAGPHRFAFYCEIGAHIGAGTLFTLPLLMLLRFVFASGDRREAILSRMDDLSAYTGRSPAVPTWLAVVLITSAALLAYLAMSAPV